MTKDLWIYLAVYLFSIIWFAIYTQDEGGWWDGMESFTPSWGSSEVLLYFIYFIWITSTLYAIYKIHKNDKEEKHNLIYYCLLTLTAVLASIQSYSLSSTKGNYEEAYYASVVAFVVNVLLAILAYKTGEKLMIWLTVLATITSGYLALWNYNVKDASGV